MLYRKNFSAKLLCVATMFALSFAAFEMIGLAQDPTGRPEDNTPKGGKKPPRRTKTPLTPQPITVILTVMTDPAESEVYINGEKRGVTDAEGKAQFEKLALGRYTVEVRKDGFVSAVRGFQAGSESPTLVFKLEPSFEEINKEFDSLAQAGKLMGPESPNAFELVESVSNKYPDRPEIARMRGALAAKLAESAAPVIARTVSKERELTRDEIARAADEMAVAAKLKSDDARIQSQAMYLQAVLALREWQSAASHENAPGNNANLENAQAGQGKEGASGDVAAKLSEARAELEKVVTIDEAWAPAWYQLGVASLKAGDAVRAEAAFIKLTQLEPRWAIAHAGLGSAYYAEGKHKESIEAFRRAIDLEPSLAAAHAGLGLARATKGDTKTGIKDIQRAMELDPASGLPHLNLGLIYSQSKKSKEIAQAIEELKKAIQKNSGNLEFQNSTAEKLLADLQKTKKK